MKNKPEMSAARPSPSHICSFFTNSIGEKACECDPSTHDLPMSNANFHQSQLELLTRCKATVHRCRSEVKLAIEVLKEGLRAEVREVMRRLEEYEGVIDRAYEVTRMETVGVRVETELAYYVDTQKAMEGIKSMCRFSNFRVQQDEATMTSMNLIHSSSPHSHPTPPGSLKLEAPGLAYTETIILSDDSSSS